MDREKIAFLLTEAMKITHHKEYVIMGSLSILGKVAAPPSDMTMSNDVDCYPLNDPGRADEMSRALGQGTEFDRQYGFYADAFRPAIAALPEGWQARLCRVESDSGVVALYLDPHDAAVAKLARCETRDRRWIRAGLVAGILDAATIAARMRSAPYLDQAEHDRAKQVLQELIALAARRKSRLGSDS